MKKTTSDCRRALKAERSNQGLCVYCGKICPEKGKKGCTACLNKKYSIQKRFCEKDRYEKNKLYRLKARQEVISKYGGKCNCCGESNFLFLVIDHINNDGFIERKALYGAPSGSGTAWLLRLRRSPVREDLQVLCYNCNSGKAHFGECPHKVLADYNDFSLLSKDRRHERKLNMTNKIDWPEDQRLLEMVLETNCHDVARKLGVHGSAVIRRLHRRGLYEEVKLRRKPYKHKKK